MYIVIEKRLTMIRDHLPGFHLLCLVVVLCQDLAQIKMRTS